MASVHKQPNGRYLVRYWTPDGRQRKRRFDKKTDADDFAATVEADKSRGVFIDPRLGNTTFAEYATRWVDGKINVRPRTAINIEGRLRGHILPVFGSRRLISIRPADVRSWVADLVAQGLAPSTVKGVFLTFGQIMRTAEIDRMIPRSPCIGIELPPQTSHEEMRFLSPEQVDALADAHDPRYRAAIVTSAFTGLRAGELWGLRLERVNVLKRTVDVVESLLEVKGRLMTGPTKTAERRTVTLPAFVAEAIARQMAEYPGQRGYLFTAPEGGPIRHRNFMDRHFYPATRLAALEGVRFHDLRHSCAAILIAQGWNPKQIQARLGHSSIRVTLDRYGHLFEGHDTALLDRLDATVRDRRVSTAGPTRVRQLSERESGARN